MFSKKTRARTGQKSTVYIYAVAESEKIVWVGR